MSISDGKGGSTGIGREEVAEESQRGPMSQGIQPKLRALTQKAVKSSRALQEL